MQQDIKPDWAPDNCPPNVVQLIEHDDFLNQMKLRGRNHHRPDQINAELAAEGHRIAVTCAGDAPSP